jgi:hypothetical protein
MLYIAMLQRQAVLVARAAPSAPPRRDRAPVRIYDCVSHLARQMCVHVRRRCASVAERARAQRGHVRLRVCVCACESLFVCVCVWVCVCVRGRVQSRRRRTVSSRSLFWSHTPSARLIAPPQTIPSAANARRGPVRKTTAWAGAKARRGPAQKPGVGRRKSPAWAGANARHGPVQKPGVGRRARRVVALCHALRKQQVRRERVVLAGDVRPHRQRVLCAAGASRGVQRGVPQREAPEGRNLQRITYVWI